MTVEYYKPNQLIMAEYNPRQLTKDQHSQLKDSIKRFGLVDPLIVNKNKERKNILVGGHQRLRIAKELGINKIPCVEVDLNIDQEKELNIRLNKNVGEWDYDSLANYFDVGELMDWGFTDDELQFYEEEPEQGLIEDDEIPEVEEAITKQGDLWILGEHRLLCGDATKKEDVDMLMNGKKADMIFTDPPYSSGGFQEAGKASGSIGTRSQKRIANDNLSTRGYKNLINNVLSINRVDTIFMFCDWRMWIENFDLCENNSYRVRNMIVWNKNRMGMGRPFRSQHELVIFGSSENIKYKKCNQANVLTVERCRNELHETQKPIELLIKVLDNMEINISKRVYDPFLGSGTTLIACEKTNRKCSGMELDPHYCDVIVKRWEEFTGKKAKRVERVEG
jgi:DNA modification methylase